MKTGAVQLNAAASSPSHPVVAVAQYDDHPLMVVGKSTKQGTNDLEFEVIEAHLILTDKSRCLLSRVPLGEMTRSTEADASAAPQPAQLTVARLERSRETSRAPSRSSVPAGRARGCYGLQPKHHEGRRDRACLDWVKRGVAGLSHARWGVRSQGSGGQMEREGVTRKVRSVALAARALSCRLGSTNR